MELLVVLMLALTTCQGTAIGGEVCGKSADIVFILDESSSIHEDDFKLQKEFVVSIIESFNVEQGQSHVGVASFSDDARIVIQLGQIFSAPQLESAVMQIRQMTGNTRTNEALDLVRERMFTAPHARSEVPHIGIVITDGDSDIHELTAEAARRAKQAGITLMAVGVGPKVGYQELRAIASQADLVFEAESYENLAAKIESMLVLKICEVITTPAPLIEPTQLDVVFCIPDEANTRDTEWAVDFVTNVVTDFEVNPALVRVALAPRVCNNAEPIYLDSHASARDFGAAMGQRVMFGARTDRQLKYLVEEAFLPDNGGRIDSVKVAVLVVDDQSVDATSTEYWVNLARLSGIELLVVGVGNDDQLGHELQRLASSQDDIIRATSYSALIHKRAELSARLCQELVEGYDYVGGRCGLLPQSRMVW